MSTKILVKNSTVYLQNISFKLQNYWGQNKIHSTLFYELPNFVMSSFPYQLIQHKTFVIQL